MLAMWRGAQERLARALDRGRRLDEHAETVELATGPLVRLRGAGAPRRAARGADADLPAVAGFTVIERIGEGAFGEVLRARDDLLGREVALKVPLPHLRFSASAKRDFLEEARALARIRHPNVLTIYGVLEQDDRLVLVMEYVRGRSLDRVLAEDGPLDAVAASRVGIQIARALSAVHAAGLVHRDLKTANVLREEDGRIVLTDFGLGLSLAEERGTAGERRIAGSPLFMAPEQVRGDDVDPRTDIYTLGVALYHLVTGRYPVMRDDLHELLRAIESEGFLPLDEVRGDLPRAFTRTVSRALARDPARRFQSAAEMERALAAVVAAA